MKTLHFAWILPLAFVLGWLAGRGTAARPAKDPPATPSGSPVRSSSPPADNGRLADLRSRRVALENTLAEARAAVPELREPEDRQAAARIVLEGFCRRDDSNPLAEWKESWIEATRRLPALGPDQAKMFIEKLEARDSRYQDEMLTECIFACGGPDVSAFLLRKLGDLKEPEAIEGTPALEQECDDVAGSLLGFLQNTTYHRLNMENIPVDGELRALAMRLAIAPDSRRAVGAALLGGSPTAETRELLQKMATTEPDSTTRAQAFIALGACGDASTIAWLESPGALPAGSADADLDRECAATALARLKRKAGR